MKINHSVLVATVLVLSSCSPASKQQVAVSSIPVQEVCYYPDSSNATSPCWVQNEFLEGGPLFQAVGSAKLGRNRSLSERRARTDAQVKLAERMSNDIASTTESYAQEVATAANETINTSNYKEATETFVKQSIKGAYVAKKKVSPAGEIYVLMVMDPKSLKDVVAQTLNLAKQEEKILMEEMKLEDAMKNLREKVQKNRSGKKS